MNKNPVGIFDSGIGGLTVLKKIREVLPNENLIYFCDSKNVPYGEKSASEVRGLVKEGVEFLISKGAKVVVIACNTATAVAIEELRRLFDIPIIGMEPAIKPAIKNNEGGKILVLATPLTLREAKFNALKHNFDLDEDCIILPAEGLASKIEEHLLKNYSKNSYSSEIERMLDKALVDIDAKKISFVVLGCTHYSFIRPYIENFFTKRAKIISGNDGTVYYLKKVLEHHGLLNQKEDMGSVDFFSSDPDLENIEEKFMGIMGNYLE